MSTFRDRCKPQLIPPISDDAIEEMLSVMRPVYSPEDGRFREILTDGVDRRDQSYIWSPKLGRAVRLYRDAFNSVMIPTFHTWSHYGLFKPSLAETLGCIRAFVPDWREVRFFWLLSDDLDGRNVIGGFHWCPCVLFGPEQPEVIDEGWEAFRLKCEGEVPCAAE